MIPRLVPKAVLVDLVTTTLLALVGMSALLMLGGAMVQASRTGLHPMRVLMAMPLLIPSMLPYTIPTCLLFACTYVYGRLASNLELVALKAGGIHPLTVLWPAILLSVATAGLCVHLTDYFIPTCNRQLTATILADLQSNVYTFLRQTGCLVEPDFPYEIFVQEVRGERLINPTFKHRSTNGYDMVVQAAEASLHVYQPDPLSTQGAIVILRMRDGVASTPGGDSVHFQDQTHQMPIPEAMRRSEDKIENLSFEGCRQRSDHFRREAIKLAFQDTALVNTALLWGKPQGIAEEMAQTGKTAERFQRRARDAQVEVQLRLVQALAPIPFVLLGCPIGLLYQRRDFLQTFFVCFLPIILGYYPMTILAFNVVKESPLDLSLTLWIPSLFMAVLAIPFFRRVIRF